MKSSSTLRYALVTPARDEAENLARLAPCILAQHAKPVRWVIVDNGSNDGTADVVAALAESHPWIDLVQLEGEAQPTRETAIGRALEAGMTAFSDLPDLVVKVDADVSFAPEFFARVVSEFERDSRLGIASGIGYERNRKGIWKQRHGSGSGVWGATRTFRRECLEQILPLDPRLGWDGIDILKAALRGWDARVIYGAQFKHHRPEGERDGSRWKVWVAEGALAHYMSYRLPYLAGRTVFRALRDPSAIGIVWGYLRSQRASEARCSDSEVVEYLRSRQRLRQVPLRAREVLRRREVLTS